MSDFAQKLMSAAQTWSSDESALLPITVLRTPLTSRKSLFRVGLWPIISTSEPEIGMGIGLVIGALLEQWSSVCVYRLMAEVSGTPSNYQWKIADSRFGVDDWEIEGLDENVAIWGRLETQNDSIHFELEVEDDARQDDSILELNLDSATLADILHELPALVTKIINWLNGASSDIVHPYQIGPSVDVQLLKDFLDDIFHWELDYYLELWGQGTDAETVLDSQTGLIEIANNLNSDFGAWLISQSISRYILFDQTIWSEWLLPLLDTTATSFAKYPFVSLIFGTLLFRQDNSLEAFDLIETSIARHPGYTRSYLALGLMYVKSHEDLSAIDIYQRAIEADAATDEIYLRYAGIMDSLAEHQIALKEGTKRVSAAGRPFSERYLFADSNNDTPSLRESCAAYRRAVELDNSNIDTLAHLVANLLALKDHDAWSYFAKLIDVDNEGAITASIIEQLADSDINQLISILESASAKEPREPSLSFNLARAYLASGLYEKAKNELNNIEVSTVPLRLHSTLSRLRLSSDDPDFDKRIGEIQDILNAKGQVDSTDIEFLEAAIKKESEYSEGYRLLAKSYLSWKESDDALEVLLDGQKIAPFDADLIVLLAKVLWDADEHDLAFSYLDQCLNNNDLNASLLSLMGRFLFDEGQDESAKDYMRQAEAVDPFNSELSATRIYIANTLIIGKKSQRQ